MLIRRVLVNSFAKYTPHLVQPKSKMASLPSKYLYVRNPGKDTTGLYYKTNFAREGTPVYKLMNGEADTERYLRHKPGEGWFVGPKFYDYRGDTREIHVPESLGGKAQVIDVADDQLYPDKAFQFLGVKNGDCSSGVYRRTSEKFNERPIYKLLNSRFGDRFLQYSDDASVGWCTSPTMKDTTEILHAMGKKDLVPWADTWSKGLSVTPTKRGELPREEQEQALRNVNPVSSSKGLLPEELKDNVSDRLKELPDAGSVSDVNPTFAISSHHLPDTPAVVSASSASPDTVTASFTEEHRDYHDGELVQLSNVPTIFIVHGFGNDLDTEWMDLMREAFMVRYSYQCNVIRVGWGDGAKFPKYKEAVANTQTVAASVADFITTLLDNSVVQPHHIHLVGHSLGAHICGQVGRKITPNLSRITGLDPAGPYFEELNGNLRLCKDSAPFVDVIHTHGYGRTEFGYGTMEELGDADFYPNGGGAPQPGVRLKDDALGESHSRAHEYFIESITALNKPDMFWARSERGEMTIPMGFNAGDEKYQALIKDNPGHGKFFLETNRSHQFSRGKRGAVEPPPTEVSDEPNDE